MTLVAWDKKTPMNRQVGGIFFSTCYVISIFCMFNQWIIGAVEIKTYPDKYSIRIQYVILAADL